MSKIEDTFTYIKSHKDHFKLLYILLFVHMYSFLPLRQYFKIWPLLNSGSCHDAIFQRVPGSLATKQPQNARDYHHDLQWVWGLSFSEQLFQQYAYTLKCANNYGVDCQYR